MFSRFRGKKWITPAVLALLLYIVLYILLVGFGKTKVRSRFFQDSSVDCSYEKLIQWGKVHGIKLHDVAISEFAFEDPAAFEESWLDSIKQRRGLIAMKDIERGAVVVEVPASELISRATIANSSHGLAEIASDKRPDGKPPIDDATLLALFLIIETHNDVSEWAPYMCHLPRRGSSSLFWDRTRLQRGASEALHKHTHHHRDHIRYLFHDVLHPYAREKHAWVAEFPHLTLRNFFWAYAAVEAQSLFVGPDKTRVLAPLADFVNHAVPPQGGVLRLVEGPGGTKAGWQTLQLVAGEGVMRGDEVLAKFYPEECNDVMLLKYGFALPTNDAKCEWAWEGSAAINHAGKSEQLFWDSDQT